jgi:hypothetical protein
MPLQIPICNFDAKTGLLCSICEAKLKNGQITQSDVDVSKALVSIAGKSRALDAVSLEKSFRAGGNYLLEVHEPGVPALQDPELKAELERALGGRFWAVSSSSSPRDIVESLLQPLRLSRLSTVWLPDGSKVVKAVIERTGRQAPRRMDEITNMVRMATGLDMMVEFPVVSHREGPTTWDDGYGVTADRYEDPMSVRN